MIISTQVVIIVGVIAILVVTGVGLALIQRDKHGRDFTRKTRTGKALTLNQKGAPRQQPGPSEWEEIQPESTPEKDRVVSFPELKDSSNPEDPVITITPPGKNGRSKHD